MRLDEMEKFRAERKWFQLCNAIIDSVEEHPVDQLVNMFLDCVGQIHPKSSSEVFLLLAEKLPVEEGVRILTVGLESLDNVVMYSGGFEVEKASLEIKRCLLLIELGETKGIEKKLFEWKSLRMPKDVSIMYNLLGFRLYEKMQNVEGAFPYLFRYMELCPKSEMMDVLVRYGLLSREFFNFTSITSHPGFDGMRNKDLREILILFREGDIDGLEKYEKKFNGMFGGDSEGVREKMYITALLNLCFNEGERQIPFEKIEKSLNISSETSTYIVLKSFGLGLINGWIDGENRVLCFSGVCPRALQPGEISRIKDKFYSWEKRVHEVISMLK